MTALIAIAVAVVEQDGQFLVGVRPEGVPLAGYSEFPGGKVQPGELAADAAARECREETGLEVIVGDELQQAVHQYDHATVRLHFFACTPRDAACVPRGPFRWVSRSELLALRFPAANAALFKHLSSPR